MNNEEMNKKEMTKKNNVDLTTAVPVILRGSVVH